MIRLSYLEFKKQQKLGPNASTTEVRDGMFGEIYLDGQEFRVGNFRYPMSSVERWTPMTKEEQGGETCDICGGWFQNATGLGAHKSHKHGIKGKTR